MRCLLTGASGRLGLHLQELWPQFFPACDLFCTDRTKTLFPDGTHCELSLATTDEVEEILRIVSPNMILHCAAISDPEEVERNPVNAWYLHQIVTSLFSQYASGGRAWLMFFSTDFVFDGFDERFYSEDDLARPTTQYGKSKLAGEAEVISLNAGLVARLSLLIDPQVSRPSGWSQVRKSLRENQPVQGVVDEWRTPIRYMSAASAILTLASQERRGIVNVAGPERLTPYDLIVRMREEMASRSTIVPIHRRRISETLVRPRNLALSTRKLESWIGTERSVLQAHIGI